MQGQGQRRLRVIGPGTFPSRAGQADLLVAWRIHGSISVYDGRCVSGFSRLWKTLERFVPAWG